MTGVQITIFHDFHRGRWWFAAYVAPRDCMSVFKREKRTLHVACRTRSKRISPPRGFPSSSSPSHAGRSWESRRQSRDRLHARVHVHARTSSRSHLVDRRSVNSRLAAYRDGIGRIQSNSSIRCPDASNHSQSEFREGFAPILM